MTKRNYSIEFTKPAKKQYDKIKDKKLKALIDDVLNNEIAPNPLIGKPLQYEYKGTRSYRLGQIRLLYNLYHDRILIVVVKIEHRKSVYRK